MNRSKTNNADAVLHEAWRLFRRRRYRETLLALQRIPAGGRASMFTDYLSAMCMLHLDLYDRAFELITRASRQYPDEPVFDEMTAYLHLKSAENSEVFTAAIVQLGLTERSLRIRRLFEYALKSEDFISFQKRVRINECVSKIHPPRNLFVFDVKKIISVLNKGRSRKNVLLLLAAVFISAAAVLVISTGQYFESIFGRLRTVGGKGETDVLFGEDDLALKRYPVIDISASQQKYQYRSSDRVLSDYASARQKVKHGDYNNALIIVNRLMNSNASVQIRERASFVKKFILAQEDRIPAGIKTEDLLKDPLLYNGVITVIKGKTANIKTKNGTTSLNLLVDFKGGNFKCMAEVLFNKDIIVEDNVIIDIECMFLYTIEESRTIIAEGIMIK